MNDKAKNNAVKALTPFRFVNSMVNELLRMKLADVLL